MNVINVMILSKVRGKFIQVDNRNVTRGANLSCNSVIALDVGVYNDRTALKVNYAERHPRVLS